MYLKGEDVTSIDHILHSLLVVLNLGGLEDYRELRCATGRNNLYSHVHASLTSACRHMLQHMLKLHNISSILHGVKTAYTLSQPVQQCSSCVLLTMPMQACCQ